jgi:hypothetical protein
MPAGDDDIAQKKKVRQGRTFSSSCTCVRTCGHQGVCKQVREKDMVGMR